MNEEEEELMSPESEREYRPSDAFRRRARARFLQEAQGLYGRKSWTRPPRLAIAAAAMAAIAVGLWWVLPQQQPVEDFRIVTEQEREIDGTRVIPDGSARWEWQDKRKIALLAGRIYLDVEPGSDPFQIVHPRGNVTVHGTRLVVTAEEKAVRVGVGSGEASLANEEGSVLLLPGEEGLAREGREPVKVDSRRFSYLADFIAGEIDETAGGSAESEGFVAGMARVPGSSSESSRLDVVNYHLDVHVEDGMARTTIDQTFFNPNWSRVEGTFLFPLPPDASISRLAMYVDGKLMEGGMAERSRAVEVYEGIVRKMKDPAILEWMEGSTFRLRIFPFEPRSERRIVLSYQQSLESLYEVDRYRFPISRPVDPWGTFSVHVLLKGAAAEGWDLTTPTYALEKVTASRGDVELSYEEKKARPAQDVLLEIHRPRRAVVDFASVEADGARMVCVTATPGIDGEVYRGPRRALLVLDRSGNASEAERKAQSRMAEKILEALDRKDRINLLTYSTEPRAWREDFARRSRKNLKAALTFLKDEAYVGAGDIAAALRRAKELFGEPREGDVIFYIGDGVDTISGIEPERIALILPTEIPFLAIPVNRSFDRVLLGSLAARSGGRVVPVSPDERIAWRAFDLVSSLRTPSWKHLDWEFLDAYGKPVAGVFHADRTSLLDGESVRLVGRIDGPWPTFLELQGEKLALPERQRGCGWIPRLWAKLRIEALERDSAAEHRDEIVGLGKSYYVMTPFTSLLVLENEAMYEQYKIDRGRRDHFALYPAPATWRGRVHAPTTPVFFWNGNVPVEFRLQNGEIRGVPPGTIFHALSPQTGLQQAVDWDTPFVFPSGNTDAWNLNTWNVIVSDTAGNSGTVNFLAANVPQRSYRFDFSGEQLVVQEDFDGDGLLYGLSPITNWGDVTLTNEFLTQDFAGNLGTSQTSGWWDPGRASAVVPLYVIPMVQDSHGATPAQEPYTQFLKDFLPTGLDLTVSFGDRRIVLFDSGERLLVEGRRAVYLGNGKSAVFEPLFDTVMPGDPLAFREWARVPWFLLTLDALTARAKVSGRAEGPRTIVTIDRQGLTTIELVFEGKRPIETRVVLRGGLVLQRMVYDAWDEVESHSLPKHGRFFGPAGTVLEEVVYAYGSPEQADRDRQAQLGKAGGEELDENLARLSLALAYYRAGNRSALESFLSEAEKKGQISEVLRKVARLAALRWGVEAVIDAPDLDRTAPAVKRWLPPEPVPLERALEHSLAFGDLTTLATLVLSTKEPKTCITHLEELREQTPAGMRGVLDLWLGELSARKGWKLKAYEAFARALGWKPIAESVALQDRLSELALALNELETSLEHAERAVEILTAKGLGASQASRFAKLVKAAAKNQEIWKERGVELLQRWAQAAPRDPKPFTRLAQLHHEAGRKSAAVRYATQGVELAPTAEEYRKLAKELERLGDQARAAACRTIAERLK